MIQELDIRRRGDAILVGIALESAILDFETTETLLRTALEMLDKPRNGADWMKIGVFGEFPVTLYLASDDSLTIVIDGPYFEPNRSVCAMIHLTKADFRDVVSRASLSS
jgi:hypothetical protein